MQSGDSSPVGSGLHTQIISPSPAAVKNGSAVLKRYQRGRDRDRSLSDSGFSSSVKLNAKGKENRLYDEDPSYFNAVADGSRLALQYSSSKRLNMRGFHESAVALDMSLAQEDDTTIEMVRQLLSELSSLTQQDDAQEVASRLPELVAFLKVSWVIEDTPSTYHSRPPLPLNLLAYFTIHPS